MIRIDIQSVKRSRDSIELFCTYKNMKVYFRFEKEAGVYSCSEMQKDFTYLRFNYVERKMFDKAAERKIEAITQHINDKAFLKAK